LDSAVYCGWRIYAHEGEVANNEIPRLKAMVKARLSQEGLEYKDEDTCTISFYHESTKSEVIATFRPQFTNVEVTMGLGGFGVVFKSDFPDWGWRAQTRQNERRHQQLRDEVFHMISWQKKTGDLIDGKLVLVPKRRRLRMVKK
jgi:hypothetical protein